jgi:hypothetical protein
LGEWLRPASRAYEPRQLDELTSLIEVLEAYIHHLEQESMAVLFPTFTNVWQRAKRLLSTDTRDIWQQLLQVTEDESELIVYAIGHLLYW